MSSRAVGGHLIASIEEHYTFSKDWAGQLYCGILTLNWNYTKRTVELSMSGYVTSALHKFQHPTPKCAQHAPHKWTAPTYGATQQLREPDNQTAALNSQGIKRVQQITGTLLVYYAWAVDPTLLVALGTIAAQQANGTEATADAIVHLLDYAVTHPDATIQY
jgi:hypothetical protein